MGRVVSQFVVFACIDCYTMNSNTLLLKTIVCNAYIHIPVPPTHLHNIRSRELSLIFEVCDTKTNTGGLLLALHGRFVNTRIDLWAPLLCSDMKERSFLSKTLYSQTTTGSPPNDAILYREIDTHF